MKFRHFVFMDMVFFLSAAVFSFNLVNLLFEF